MRCKHIKKDGFQCASYAFNLYMDDIDQGELCDVHYWQERALEAVLEEREACAKLCESFQARDVGMQPAECAGAIRARGEA